MQTAGVTLSPGKRSCDGQRWNGSDVVELHNVMRCDTFPTKGVVLTEIID